MDKMFDDFQIGDTYIQKKVFKRSDFTAFSKLSGDINPLHHDEEYAKLSTFKEIIVPMHLVIAPLSSIAGMVFPGHRSLYLGHEVKSHLPVFFDKEIIYSSKIIEKHAAERVLSIRTIVFQGTDVLLSANQKVQVRDDPIDPGKLKNMKLKGQLISNEERSILITGAAGEIGQSITLQLAKKEKNLILLVRNLNQRTKKVIDSVKEYSKNIHVIEMDLSNQIDHKKLEKFINKYDGFIESVIYAASPKISSTIDKQMAINYSALKAITEICLPSWLSRQEGQIIYLSSSAIHFHPHGIDDYTTAKAAGTNYLDGIRKRFFQWGLKTHCLASGKVNTKFSDTLNLPNITQMIPEQVAENVVKILEDKNSSDFYYWLENTGLRVGNYDFIQNKTKNIQLTKNQDTILLKGEESIAKTEALQNLIIDFFNLNENVNWDNVGIGLISGWDSFRHIEFILEIENRFNINFDAEEIDLTTNFNDLSNLLLDK